MAKTKYLWLSKKYLCQISHSNEKPRHWYSVNKLSDFKEIRYFSIEKHVKNDMISYKLIIGPLMFAIGWLDK